MSEPKLLVVDDDKQNRAILAELLKGEGRILLAKSGRMALDLVQRHAPDVILLDVMMPEMDGYQVLEILKSDDATREIPVILITGLTATEEEERGLALGAADYITKPFHAPIVSLRVRNHIRSVRQRHLLEQMAMLDPLCEIPNRRRLASTMQEIRPPGTHISVVMIDVDHFKLYNDHYGHAAGDLVLKRIAGALADQLRRFGDLAVRYGGEEFALFLPDTDHIGGMQLARKVLNGIAALELPHARSPVASRVSISMGGATAPAIGGLVPEDLLERADRQLYLAKEAGRNRVAWEGETIHIEE